MAVVYEYDRCHREGAGLAGFEQALLGIAGKIWINALGQGLPVIAF
jgi:hypothetical protein